MSENGILCDPSKRSRELILMLKGDRLSLQIERKALDYQRRAAEITTDSRQRRAIDVEVDYNSGRIKQSLKVIERRLQKLEPKGK